MRRLVVLVFLVAAACERSNEAARAPDEHPPMQAAEEERGLKLCQAYVDRVCGCAARDPTLRDTCDLAKGQPSAVRMHLDVLHGAPLAKVEGDGQVKKDDATGGKRPPLNENERRLTESSLRKVVAACVQLDAQLPPSCPRPSP